MVAPSLDISSLGHMSTPLLVMHRSAFLLRSQPRFAAWAQTVAGPGGLVVRLARVPS